MRPPVLARPRLARELNHEPARRAFRQLAKKRFDRGNVREAVQALAIDAQLSGGLWPPQHQHRE
jgi:hypothetical protein